MWWSVQNGFLVLILAVSLTQLAQSCAGSTQDASPQGRGPSGAGASGLTALRWELADLGSLQPQVRNGGRGGLRILNQENLRHRAQGMTTATCCMLLGQLGSLLKCLWPASVSGLESALEAGVERQRVLPDPGFRTNSKTCHSHRGQVTREIVPCLPGHPDLETKRRI